ncbi:invasion associated locus B family protein [Ensifer sp. 4252]|uniref:invasion associated locus B family protein n=1 Tax=Ensifer sp. 4252 TaxID=3373915 RepID=UPI003D252BDD
MRLLRWATLLLMVTIVAISPLHAQQASKDGPAPSSLAETYDDWSVACSTTDGNRRCVLSQRQFHESGQRVLTLELESVDDAAVQGQLALPFGLYLDKGVSLGVDDATGSKPSRFRTCMPVGCIVALTFNEETIKLLRGGKVLKLIAFASDTEKQVSFSISLKGFGAALDRTIVLMQKA